MEGNMPERIDRTVVYESDWVDLYLDKVKMPNGYVIDKYHRLHYHNESVSVVIINDMSQILLIQSKRYATSRLEWEIPAGRVENGESLEDAAIRECREETGCVVKDLQYMGCYNPSNGMSDLKEHMFVARISSETETIDENEVNAKRWFSKSQVLELLKENRTYSGVSMMGLLYALQFYGNKFSN